MDSVFPGYLKGESNDKFLVSPVINSYMTASLLNKEWISDVTFEDKLKVIDMCGIDPTYYPIGDLSELFGGFEPLGWECRVMYQDDNRKEYEYVLHTDKGDLTRKIKEIKNNAPMQTESPIKSESDYDKLIWWLRSARKQANRITSRYEGFKKKVDDKGLLVFQVPLPFELMWWVSREEPIYHLFDWPKTLKKFEEEAMETLVVFIEAAVKGGADLIFFGSVGTELYSEDIFVEHMLEDSILVSKLAKKLNVLSIFHCCGKAKKWIDTGYINEISPDIFEGLTPAPLGDIDNIRTYREKLDKSIVTRGGVDLSTLLNGGLDDIRAQVEKVFEDYRDYKHLIAGTCEILYGTSLNNIKGLVNIITDLDKRFN